jgi:hypothetical protein
MHKKDAQSAVLQPGITKQQKKVIWSIWKKGICIPDDDVLYSLIKQQTGKDHMSEMTQKEAEALIYFLRQKSEGSLQGATAAQMYRIREYARQWHWSEAGLRKFLLRVTKKDKMLELTPQEARNVLAAMERIRRKNDLNKSHQAA